MGLERAARGMTTIAPSPVTERGRSRRIARTRARARQIADDGAHAFTRTADCEIEIRIVRAVRGKAIDLPNLLRQRELTDMSAF